MVSREKMLVVWKAQIKKNSIRAIALDFKLSMVALVQQKQN